MTHRQSTGIAKAKYVVETTCSNGNVFLHGPFGSKTTASEFVLDYELNDQKFKEVIRPTNIHKVRMVMHPTKWTKGSS